MEFAKKSCAFTKKIKRIMGRLILLLTLVLSQCVSAPETNNAPCDKSEINNQKSADYYAKYYMDGDQSHLDSALFYIDEVLGSCEKYAGLLSLRKLSILSVKRDYSQALQFIETFDEEIFSDLPYFQNLLKNRFNAMKSQAEGDFDMRDYYLKSSIEEINKFLSMNKTKGDSLLGLSDISIGSNPSCTTHELLVSFDRNDGRQCCSA